MSKNIPTAVGAVALLSTTLVEVFTILVAATVTEPNLPIRTPAIVASLVGPLNVAGLVVLLIGNLQRRHQYEMARPQSPWLALVSLVLGTISAIISMVTFVLTQDHLDNLPTTVAGSSPGSLLIGAFVCDCFAILSQGLYLTSTFTAMKGEKSKSQSLHTMASMPFSPEMAEPKRPMPVLRKSSISSIAQGSVTRSASDAMSSVRSSMSQRVRPVTSRTRLLVSRASSRRTRYSYESSVAGAAPVTEDGFDSWDTSAVDPESRMTISTSSPPLPTPQEAHVLETIPASPFLETIPASPSVSRTPSPPSPLEPPSMSAARRSRTYSNASSINSGRRGGACSPTPSEAHIHPLFRSDSPFGEAPQVTPSTMITAAPFAGCVLTDRQSIASLNRLRSASTNNLVSPNPTIRSTASVEGFPWHMSSDAIAAASLHSLQASPSLNSLRTVPEKGFAREPASPIPDFIMSAGSRSSLSNYQVRKLNPGLADD